MQLVTYSTLYPNAAQPRHGLFVEARLHALRSNHDVAADVIAPVPWFPLRNDRFGTYARFARAPRREVRRGVEVLHPRYALLPKVGMHIAPRSMALGSRRALRDLLAGHMQKPILDAHYFYPDGVAAARLARAFDLPLVISARGSDINLLATFPAVRRRILWAAEQASAVVAVSQALAREMAAIGIAPSKIEVIENGVDLKLFAPMDRAAVRRKLDLDGPVLLSVGNLIDLKGHDLIIEALREVPAATLIIAGEGPNGTALMAQVARLGLQQRVRFVGSVKQNDLVSYYNAADLLILASSREGMANVLLESVACGTPALATPVGGNAEVIASRDAGRIMAERSAAAIALGVNELLAALPDRAATRDYAQRFAWPEKARRLHELFSAVAAGFNAGQPQRLHLKN